MYPINKFILFSTINLFCQNILLGSKIRNHLSQPDSSFHEIKTLCRALLFVSPYHLCCCFGFYHYNQLLWALETNIVIIQHCKRNFQKSSGLNSIVTSTLYRNSASKFWKTCYIKTDISILIKLWDDICSTHHCSYMKLKYKRNPFLPRERSNLLFSVRILQLCIV